MVDIHNFEYLVARLQTHNGQQTAMALSISATTQTSAILLMVHLSFLSTSCLHSTAQKLVSWWLLRQPVRPYLYQLACPQAQLLQLLPLEQVLMSRR